MHNTISDVLFIFNAMPANHLLFYDSRYAYAGNGTRESKRKKRADQKAPQADAAAAEEQDSEGRVVRRRTVRKIQPEVQVTTLYISTSWGPCSAVSHLECTDFT